MLLDLLRAVRVCEVGGGVVCVRGCYCELRKTMPTTRYYRHAQTRVQLQPNTENWQYTHTHTHTHTLEDLLRKHQKEAHYTEQGLHYTQSKGYIS